MLKPVEVLIQYGKSVGLSHDEIQRKQDKLLDVLLHPKRADHGEAVAEVFAHGAEAMRVAAIKEDGDRYPHWAVQTWSAIKEDWLTQKTYEMKPAMRNAAYMDAKEWYPAPSQADALVKWNDINSMKDGALELLIDSRAKLAEFWYETKVIDWQGRYDGEPWGFMSEVAATVFERDGKPNSFLGEKHCEKVVIQLANFAYEWGEQAKPVLSGSLRKAGTNEVEAIVQYWSTESAVDQIRDSGHDAVLASCALGEVSQDKFLYSQERDAALPREQVIKALNDFIEQNKKLSLDGDEKEDSFTVSVFYEKWTPEDTEAGEPGERGVEVEREVVDADKLKEYGRDYGMSEPSATDPTMTPNIWFSSTSPTEDREHFEKGINKFYSLHVHDVNGHEPDAEDYQRVANLIGVKFDRPVQLTVESDEKPIYGYYIDLDERGDFQADVRDAQGQTVFDIRDGGSLGEDESSIFEDGYMRNKNDIEGLTTHLRDLGVIPTDADVLTRSDFEDQLEERKQSGSDLSFS